MIFASVVALHIAVVWGFLAGAQPPMVHSLPGSLQLVFIAQTIIAPDIPVRNRMRNTRPSVQQRERWEEHAAKQTMGNHPIAFAANSRLPCADRSA